MKKARDYQVECVEQVRSEFRNGQKTALVKLPTGSGKSFTAWYFISEILKVKPDYRVLILAPKVAIVREFVGLIPTTLLSVASNSYGVVDTSGQIVVATYQTVHKRSLPTFDLIVADEQHRCNDINVKSNYYQVVNRVLALNPDTRLLGLTATPFRDTGYTYGPARLFSHITFERDIVWTTECGYTVPAKMFAPKEHQISTKDLKVDNTGEYVQWQVKELVADPAKARKQCEDIIARTKDRKKIAIACASIDHAELIAKIILDLGEKVSVVHSRQDDDEKDVSLGAFETDWSVRFCTFVTMIAEGFNYPPIDCIVLLRPTRRVNLAHQLIGRSLRPSPETNKEYALVLDYGQVVENCGPLNAPFVSEGGVRGLERAQEQSDTKVKICGECGAFLFTPQGTTQYECTECGHTWTEVRQVDTKLDTEPAIVDLYIKSKKEKHEGTVVKIHYKPIGHTQDMKHRMKQIVCEMLDGQEVVFFVRNPLMAEIDESLPYDQKKWLEGLELKMQILIKDFSDKHQHMKSIYDCKYLPSDKEVHLKWTGKNGYAQYKSHTVSDKYTLDTPIEGKPDKKKDKLAIASHVSAIENILGGRIVAKKAMAKDDKLFLKRGY